MATRVTGVNIPVVVDPTAAERGLKRVQDRMNKLGGAGARIGGAAVGGPLGKLAALGGVGGGVGMAAMGTVGSLAVLATPFLAASGILTSLASATDRAKKAIEEFDESGKSVRNSIGVTEPLARRLADASDRIAGSAANTKGFWDTFWAAGMDTSGRAGVLESWASSFLNEVKGQVAELGALAGGKTLQEAEIISMMATAPTDAAAQAWVPELRAAERTGAGQSSRFDWSGQRSAAELADALRRVFG